MKCLSALVVLTTIMATTVNSGVLPWSVEDAQLFYDYSLAAYCPITEIQHWNCTYCEEGGAAKAAFGSPAGEIFGYVAANSTSSQIVVSFRGKTERALESWASDFDSQVSSAGAQLEQFLWMPPGAEVLTAFAEAYMNVSAEFFSELGKAYNANPTYTVVFTGRDFGAALATLAAAHVTNRTKVQVNLWTYSSPRVGNYDFANLLADRLASSYRHTWENDAIPHYPSTSFSYYHLNNEIFYDDGSYTECYNENPSCADQFTTVSFPVSFAYFGLTELACGIGNHSTTSTGGTGGSSTASTTRTTGGSGGSSGGSKSGGSGGGSGGAGSKSSNSQKSFTSTQSQSGGKDSFTNYKTSTGATTYGGSNNHGSSSHQAGSSTFHGSSAAAAAAASTFHGSSAAAAAAASTFHGSSAAAAAASSFHGSSGGAAAAAASSFHGSSGGPGGSYYGGSGGGGGSGYGSYMPKRK